jgi:hypothetical protein
MALGSGKNFSESRGHKGKGTGSRIRIRNTASHKSIISRKTLLLLFTELIIVISGDHSLRVPPPGVQSLRLLQQ